MTESNYFSNPLYRFFDKSAFVVIHRPTLQICKNMRFPHAAAIFIEQLISLHIYHQEEWVYYTREQWETEFLLTEWQIRCIIDDFKKAGLLTTRRRRIYKKDDLREDGEPKTYAVFRVDLARFEEMLRELPQRGEKKGNGGGEKKRKKATPQVWEEQLKNPPVECVATASPIECVSTVSPIECVATAYIENKNLEEEFKKHILGDEVAIQDSPYVDSQKLEDGFGGKKMGKDSSEKVIEKRRDLFFDYVAQYSGLKNGAMIGKIVKLLKNNGIDINEIELVANYIQTRCFVTPQPFIQIGSWEKYLSDYLSFKQKDHGAEAALELSLSKALYGGEMPQSAIYEIARLASALHRDGVTPDEVARGIQHLRATDYRYQNRTADPRSLLRDLVAWKYRQKSLQAPSSPSHEQTGLSDADMEKLKERIAYLTDAFGDSNGQS